MDITPNSLIKKRNMMRRKINRSVLLGQRAVVKQGIIVLILSLPAINGISIMGR